MVWYAEFKGNPVAARMEAQRIITQRAIKELNLSPDQVISRPLRPNDIGLTGGTWATVEAVTTTPLATYVNASIANNRWLTINGLYLAKGPALANTAPATLTAGSVDLINNRNDIQNIQIQRGAQTARDWDVTPIPSWPSQTGWVDDPFSVNQNQNLTILLGAQTACTLEGRKHAFIGDVAERRGLVINPTV